MAISPGKPDVNVEEAVVDVAEPGEVKGVDGLDPPPKDDEAPGLGDEGNGC